MSSATPTFEIGARALGYYGLMASWRRRSDGRWEPSVCIASAASTDDSTYEPAQSVTINSRAGLIALREVIDEALRQEPSGPAGQAGGAA